MPLFMKQFYIIKRTCFEHVLNSTVSFHNKCLVMLIFIFMTNTRRYLYEYSIFQEERPVFSNWSPLIRDLLDRLLTLAPSARVSCLKELKQAKAMRDLDFDKVLNKQIKPRFTPPKDHLNCDPTFELEEMIIETKPLHKKKKRLAKQRLVAFRDHRSFYC